jgi:hypothetical protein
VIYLPKENLKTFLALVNHFFPSNSGSDGFETEDVGELVDKINLDIHP